MGLGREKTLFSPAFAEATGKWAWYEWCLRSAEVCDHAPVRIDIVAR